MSQSTCVIIFTKAPVAGQVKTRLIPLLGEAGAVTFYQQLLTDTVNRFSGHTDWDLQLSVAGDIHHDAITSLTKSHPLEVVPQQGRDLGARMAFAANNALHRYDKVLLVGCDCPLLTSEVLVQVNTALNQSSICIVPAEDGGYVCMGLSAFLPSVFDCIDWGTERVLAQTCLALEKLVIEPALLSPLWDIDLPEDYQRYLSIHRALNL